jgi:transketolase
MPLPEKNINNIDSKDSCLTLGVLQRMARQVRRKTMEIIYKTGSPHIGSSFSIVEILTVLYFRILSITPGEMESPERDRFILSKGHACPALYVTLFLRGLMTQESLDGFAVDQGCLEHHPTKNLSSGIELSTGSLGHGLSVACGMAFAAKYDRSPARIFTLMGDGELNEGSNWEAILFAAHWKLDNLVAIIDYNRIQALGRTEEILDLDPLPDKWRSFGWEVAVVDGHDINELLKVFENISIHAQKPTVIIANTTKGKGVCFMENDLLWHYRCPDDEEYAKATCELNEL